MRRRYKVTVILPENQELNEMNTEISENLISEGENLTQTISYVPAGHNVIRTYSVYRTSDQEKY